MGGGQYHGVGSRDGAVDGSGDRCQFERVATSLGVTRRAVVSVKTTARRTFLFLFLANKPLFRGLVLLAHRGQGRRRCAGARVRSK